MAHGIHPTSEAASRCGGKRSFQCVGTTQFFDEIFPACTQAWRDVNSCTAGVAPTPASNWECLDFTTGTASTPCATQITALNDCIASN